MTNRFAAEMDALDRKAGRVHTLADTTLVYEKSQTTPGAITDDDLLIVRFFHGEQAAEKYVALRTRALAPPAPAPVPAPTNAPSRAALWQKYPNADAYLAAFKRAYAQFTDDAKSVTADDWQLLTQSVAAWELHSLREYAKDMIERNKQRNDERIDALEQEIAALKATALKGGATWQRGVSYAVNDCVQHGGSLWRCVEMHVSGATFSHECFLLQVKSGRDGKDAR